MNFEPKIVGTNMTFLLKKQSARQLMIKLFFYSETVDIGLIKALIQHDKIYCSGLVAADMYHALRK